jgi:molybdate transport system regulatory protein
MMVHSEKRYSPFSICGNMWIEKEGECFLGPGRIVLLNNIWKEGSINAAAKKSGISYQHAWKVLEQMNRLSPLPVMVPHRGGKDGGGSKFTPYGIRLVTNVNQIDEQFREFLVMINSEFDICF